MSEVFAQPNQRSGTAAPNAETIQKLLDENTQLIALIHEHFNKGRISESVELQKHLHRNLFYLTCLAYPANQVQQLLPPPEMLQQQQQQQMQIQANLNGQPQQHQLYNQFQQQGQQPMIIIQQQQQQPQQHPQIIMHPASLQQLQQQQQQPTHIIIQQQPPQQQQQGQQSQPQQQQQQFNNHIKS